MTVAPFFCSNLSRANGETIFGTAPHVATWLLLEHPAGWSARGFPDDRLSGEVRRHLRDLCAAIPNSRPLMIRQNHLRGEHIRCFVLHSREQSQEAFEFRFSNYEDLLGLDAGSLLDPSRAKRFTAPFYLVCTHGKHDKCCAKFGFGTYCAVRDVAGREAWECSHVGGDRFAANLLCLPEGLYYGHVFPDDVAKIVDAHRKGRIVLEHYRGRSCYGRVAQIGEYFVRRESGLTGLDDLIFDGSAEIGRHGWRARFRSTAGGWRYEVEFSRRRTGVTEMFTCDATEAKAVVEYVLDRFAGVSA